MKSEEALEERLRKLGDAVAPDESFARGVMARVEATRVEQTHVGARRGLGWRVIRPAMALAACVAIVCIVKWALGPGDEGLYRRVSAAVDATHTIHAVAEAMQDGQWGKRGEIWYQRGKGIVLHEFLGGRQRILIDNGEHRWEYTKGATTALRRTSIDPLEEVKDLLNVEALRQELVRMEAEDRVLDGIPCKCYGRESEDGLSREMAWIDSEDLVRLWEEHRRQDTETDFTPDEIVTIEYGMDIDPALYEPNFGSDVRIVDEAAADDLVQAWLAESKPLFEKEMLGLDLAVHEIARFGDDYVYLVCSVQPSDETVQAFGLGPTRYQDGRQAYGNYGNFALTYWWERLDDGQLFEHAYRIKDFMTLRHGGVEVHWYVMERVGEWPGQDETFELCGYVHTRDKLEEHLAAQGLHTWVKQVPIAELPLADRVLTQEDVAAKIWLDAQSLGAACNDVYVHLRSRERTEEEIQEDVDLGMDRAEAERLRRAVLRSPRDLSQREFLDIFGEALDRLGSDEEM